jgi:S-layer family protein
MARGRRLLGQLVLVLAVTAGAFVGAKLGMLGTRDAGASHNFSDVPDGAFYHDFVAFLVDNGITAGCAPSLFCGEQAVTRGQAAVFLPLP